MRGGHKCLRCGGEGEDDQEHEFYDSATDETIEIKGCQWSRVTRFSMMMLEYLGHMESGWLPVAGGLLDQSAIFLASARVIRSAVAEAERQEKLAGVGTSRV